MENKLNIEGNEKPSLKELSDALENNGWTYHEEPDRPLFGRIYSRENNPILQGTEWRQAIITFREDQHIPEGADDILAGTRKESIAVVIRCDTQNREQLMRALQLDQHLRTWGFEEDDDSSSPSAYPTNRTA